MDKLKKQMAVGDSDNQLSLQREVRRLRDLLDESIKMVAVLYEDKVAGKISQDTFAALLDKNERERQRRQARFEEADARLSGIREKILNVSQWAAIIKKHSQITEITREDIEELIDHIEIGESDYSSGKRVQEIRIYWRFIGLIGT